MAKLVHSQSMYTRKHSSAADESARVSIESNRNETKLQNFETSKLRKFKSSKLQKFETSKEIGKSKTPLSQKAKILFVVRGAYVRACVRVCR